MLAHLKTCLSRQTGSDRARVAPLALMRIQPDGAPIYWLDVAIKPQAQLKDLDQLLRRAWLECCGHLSEFYSGSRRAVNMNTAIADVLGSVGDRLGYVYDFGSSTELSVACGATVLSRPDRTARVVARNEPISWPCADCDRPATVVCGHCSWEGDAFYCAEHAEIHECSDEMLLPVTNSPRMGVCGYMGEA